MFRPNRLKARIRAGEKSLGTWVQSASLINAEMAAAAGFDFFIIDQEHGPGDLDAAVNMMRAASGAPATAIVRVPPGDPVYVKRLVEAGVEGILIPMLDTADQAREIVQACRFPPRGTRGYAWDIARASSYGFATDYYAQADDNLLIIAQIETATAVANAKDIAEVDGVDLLFIGPSDLSSSIGLPGQTGAPEVERLIQRTVEAVRATGKPLATVPRQGRTWRQLFDEGFVVVPCGSDISFYRQSLSLAMDDYRRYEAERR
jgi:4-hydroxy-2-oxoheptanedioate aldolase